MDTDALLAASVAVMVALVSYPFVTLIQGFLGRKRMTAEVQDLYAAAGERTVDTLLKSIAHLEKQLAETRAELAEMKRENELLRAEVHGLTKQMKRGQR